MTAPLLSAQHLRLVFDGFEAVKDVSLVLEDGQILTLVGPSGCGKSSVLRALAGLETPAGGTIAMRGKPNLSFVFQDPALMPWTTVAANTALPLKLAGGAQHLGAVTQALERVGLMGREGAYPSQLSGGMRMRVSIARALASQPDIMLMDEPFAALDELRRFDLAQLVRDVAQDQGLAVVFVTHSVFEACFLSDQILVMTPGPGAIAQTIDVPAPGKRDADFRESDVFSAAASAVSAALRGAAGDVVA